MLERLPDRVAVNIICRVNSIHCSRYGKNIVDLRSRFGTRVASSWRQRNLVFRSGARNLPLSARGVICFVFLLSSGAVLVRFETYSGWIYGPNLNRFRFAFGFSRKSCPLILQYTVGGGRKTLWTIEAEFAVYLHGHGWHRANRQSTRPGVWSRHWLPNSAWRR